MEGNYSMGEKKGLFTFYYLNGQKENSGYYSDNKKTGQWESFHPNGKLHKVTEYIAPQMYLLHALWDSLGNQLVGGGNGTWLETNRNTNNNRLIFILGKVEQGRREGKWQVRYANGELLLEEHFIEGKFKFGEQWEKGTKKLYFQSSILADEYAEITHPELFLYDQGQMDKNFYGEGLYFFLHTFLGKPYASIQEKELINMNEATVKCKKETFVAAHYPGGPLALYRFIGQMKKTTSDPEDISGMVIITLRINRYGMVRDYYVSKGINIIQNRKAIEKVKKIRWSPATCGSANINSYKRIAIFY
jgi:hypothetical protein